MQIYQGISALVGMNDFPKDLQFFILIFFSQSNLFLNSINYYSLIILNDNFSIYFPILCSNMYQIYRSSSSLFGSCFDA